MKLGFVTARMARRDRSSPSGWVTDAGVGRLLSALGDRVSTLSVAMSIVPGNNPLFDHPINLQPSQVVPLPEMTSFQAGFFQHTACKRVLAEIESRSDVVIVQLPHSAPTSLFGQTKPRIYHVCADVLSIVRDTKRYRGIKRAASLGMAYLVEGIHQQLIRQPNVRLITNGADLAKRYHAAESDVAVSASLFDKDVLSVSRSRPQDGPKRILFVGHLRAEKGFDTLLAAFLEVRKTIPNAELHIVGPQIGSHADVSGELSRSMGRLEDEGAIRMHGPVGFGLDLFQQFADADVLVLPSRSEGTPRVLVEARAFGCPVVASNVGGVPTSVDDGKDGLLVSPGNAPAFAAAILRILNDTELKDRLVRAGIERARSATVEKFADQFMRQASTLLRSSSA